jgi:hypothetical protein
MSLTVYCLLLSQSLTKLMLARLRAVGNFRECLRNESPHSLKLRWAQGFNSVVSRFLEPKNLMEYGSLKIKDQTHQFFQRSSFRNPDVNIEIFKSG